MPLFRSVRFLPQRLVAAVGLFVLLGFMFWGGDLVEAVGLNRRATGPLAILLAAPLIYYAASGIDWDVIERERAEKRKAKVDRRKS